MKISEGKKSPGVLKLNIFDVIHTDRLWESARNAAGLTPEQLIRVRKSEISWRFWKSDTWNLEFSLFTRYKASQRLYNDMKELDVLRIHSGSGTGCFLADKVYFMDSPVRWSTWRAPKYIPF